MAENLDLTDLYEWIKKTYDDKRFVLTDEMIDVFELKSYFTSTSSTSLEFNENKKELIELTVVGSEAESTFFLVNENHLIGFENKQLKKFFDDQCQLKKLYPELERCVLKKYPKIISESNILKISHYLDNEQNQILKFTLFGTLYSSSSLVTQKSTTFIDDGEKIFIVKKPYGRTKKILSYELLTPIEKYLVPYFKKRHPFISEFYNEQRNCIPILWEEVINSKSALELFKKKYKNTKWTKRVNQTSLVNTYVLYKLKKLISDDLYQQVFNYIYQHKDYNFVLDQGFGQSKHFQMQRASKLLAEWTLHRLKIDDTNINRDLISDMFYMQYLLGLPIKLDSTSLNGIKRKHDKLVAELNFREKVAFKEPIEQGEYKKIIALLAENKPEYRHLSMYSDFVQEGRKMHNCVAGYYDWARVGVCQIFHVIFDQAHYTLELRLNDDKEVFSGQFYGPCNELPEQDHEKRLEKDLCWVNKELKTTRKKYIRKT